MFFSGELDMIFIVETWLSDNIPDTLLINNFDYQIFRTDRFSRGGGVCIILKSYLSARKTKSINNSFYELLCIDLNVKPTPIRFILVYFPPKCTIIDICNLVDDLNQLIKRNLNYIILGDFNLPDIDWKLVFPLKNIEINNIFCDFVLENSLTQVVNFSTRQNNILDIILTNDIHQIISICPNYPFANSDHNSISFKIPINEKIDNQHACFYELYKHTDFLSMNTFLAEIDWAFLFRDCVHINDFWFIFKQTLLHCIDLYVPVRKQKVKFYTLSRDIKKLQNKKRLLWKKCGYLTIVYVIII